MLDMNYYKNNFEVNKDFMTHKTKMEDRQKKM